MRQSQQGAALTSSEESEDGGGGGGNKACGDHNSQAQTQAIFDWDGDKKIEGLK